MAEIRILGLDDSVTKAEVVRAISEAGGCAEADITVGDIRQRAPNSMGTIWARCPCAAARKVVIGKRLIIGWFSARVEALQARPLQCYRCLRNGHVSSKCTEGVDRSGRCFACGRTGHRARDCTGKLRCPLCSDLGCPAEHRLGSRECNPLADARNKPGVGVRDISKEGGPEKAMETQE